MKLAGRGVIVTGANQGLGLEIAKLAVAEGADVVMCARNAGMLEQAQSVVAAAAPEGVRVIAVPADVSRPEDVERLFDAASRLPRITGLVNNAGIYGPKGPVETVDWDQWQQTITVNLMGTVLPCRHAAPLFRAAGYGKIVNLSGGGATAPLPFLSAYAASKAAVVRFTETLSEELKGSAVDVNAVAPGALNTRMLDEVLAAGPEKVGAAFHQKALKQKEDGGAPLEKGASLCVYLLSGESDGITGRLLSAIWDPWQDFASHRERIARSDVYTLRRIVPADRPGEWE